MNKSDSLVVRKQVIKFILEWVNLPEATVGKLRVDRIGLGQDNLDLLFHGRLDFICSLAFAVRLIDRLILLVIVGRIVRRDDRIEALEALHDVVHVDIELIGFVLVRNGGGCSAAQISGISLIRNLELLSDEALPVLGQNFA